MALTNLKTSTTRASKMQTASNNWARSITHIWISTIYHLHTIWLMIDAYMKCVAIPMAVFGILSACSGPVLTNNGNPQILPILARAPVAFSWLCLMLVHFAASNQMRPQAIEEDKVNKPWRPIPAGRITSKGMRYLFLALIPLEIIISASLGALFPCIAHMIVASMHDDLKLADTGYFMRNVLVALGYMCYASGSTAIATGLGNDGANPDFWWWMLVVAAQIFTTIQVQDLPDVEGDLVKGRRTMPIVLGDVVTRWSIAVPVIFWSLFCPIYYWDCGLISSMVVIFSGGYIVIRVLLYRSAEEDEITWKSWCAWATFLYTLPLAHSLST